MPEGFAIRRNGTCLSSESNCGATISPFSACCPDGLSCANKYNQVCCSLGTNCTAAIVQRPLCGDPSWALYNNGGVDSGYFCCSNQTTGYAATLTDSSGCANAGVVLEPGEVRLAAISQAVSSSTISSSSSISRTTSTATTTSSSSSNSNSSSQFPTVQVLIGVVLGGFALALLIYLFFRWKRRQRARRARTNDLPLLDTRHELGHHDSKSEIGGHAISELPTKTNSVGAIGEPRAKTNAIVARPPQGLNGHYGPVELQ